MRVRVTAPQLTEGDKDYQAGEVVDIQNATRVATLIRRGYVVALLEEPTSEPGEEPIAPPDVKQHRAANKGRTAENKEA